MIARTCLSTSWREALGCGLGDGLEVGGWVGLVFIIIIIIIITLFFFFLPLFLSINSVRNKKLRVKKKWESFLQAPLIYIYIYYVVVFLIYIVHVMFVVADLRALCADVCETFHFAVGRNP